MQRQTVLCGLLLQPKTVVMSPKTLCKVQGAKVQNGELDIVSHSIMYVSLLSQVLKGSKQCLWPDWCQNVAEGLED